MTVKQLRDALAKFPDEMPVLRNDSSDDYTEIMAVEAVKAMKDRHDLWHPGAVKAAKPNVLLLT